MRRADGQGTIEYVAVVALVAGLLVAGGALVGAPAIANAVGRAMGRALCEVTGRSCPTLDPEACTVRSTAMTGTVGVKVVVVRAGREMAIVRAERSDGTIALTLLDHSDAGLETLLGAKGHVELGDASIGTGAVAEASLVARFGGGRTWTVRSAAAADALQRKLYEVAGGRALGGRLSILPNPVDLAARALGRGAHLALPEPDSTVSSGGVTAGVDIQAGPLAGLRGALGAEVGRVRARDGSTTWLGALKLDAGAALLGELGLEPHADGEVSIAVTTGPDGRLRTLAVGGSGGLSQSAAASVGRFGATLGANRTAAVELTATLDLEDDVDRRAVEELLRGLRGVDLGRVHRAAGVLAGRLRDAAAIDLATYRRDSRSYGGGLNVGAEVQAGLDAELSRSRSDLTGAWWRPPGGAWETRADCLAA